MYMTNMRQCRSHGYTRGHFHRDTVSCIRHLYLPNIVSQPICPSHISLMSTSEHGDQAEIVASVHHSPGQPPLEPAIEDKALPGSLSAVLNTPDETACERERLSTSQIAGAIIHYYASIQNLMLSPGNGSVPKKGGSTITNSERLIKTARTSIEDELQQQGAISVPRREKYLGSTSLIHQCSKIPSPE